MFKKGFILTVAFLMLFSLLNIPHAKAQTIETAITSKSFDGQFYIVKGKITVSNLNPPGQLPEEDQVSIAADILGKNGTWPVLPDSYSIGGGGEVKNGKVLTREEVNGTNCKTLNLWNWQVRGPQAWREGASEVNGQFHFDASKMKSTYSKNFVIKIPKKYASNTVRIRARLNHVWGGPFANWPAFSYHHKILYQGKLCEIAGKRKESKITAKEKILNHLRELNNIFRNATKKNKKEGMHIFNEPPQINIDQNYRDKVKNALENIRKKNKFKTVEVQKAGEKKKKVKTSDPTWKDKLKYHVGKYFTDKITGVVPGGSIVSNEINNAINQKLGLGDIKKTQIELGVDSLSAGLYNKFNSITDLENKYSKIKGIIGEISSKLSKPVSWVLDKLGIITKKRIAVSYELEYKTLIAKIKKSKTSEEALIRDIKSDGVIIINVQQLKTKDFTGTNPSQIANKYSKGEFKDPVKRAKFYIELAREKGDLK